MTIKTQLTRLFFFLSFSVLIIGCKSVAQKVNTNLDTIYSCSEFKKSTPTAEWEEFSSLFTANSIKSERFEGLNQDEKHFLQSAKEAKAWDLFEEATTLLQADKNRKKANNLFTKIATDYPQTYYANQAKELSNLLSQMMIEDANWKEPSDINDLSLHQQIEYHIYQLRNIAAEQIGQPANCSVFDTPKGEYNAAISLKKIGKPAIPFLINLLDDRRPLSTIGYFRDFYPTRTILRYQDAAVEILNQITQESFYTNTCTACYFSTESCEFRTQKWNDIKNWYNKEPKNN
ncbi:hypothetical protein [uncultured Kordia sp.]|uniref:hypothetical protein n=1 Tax=uncultured Kordia sp. TaxID=507699 RepID=UPI002603E84B|nr:hypothetical protein [uncultured Kordia sp.]